MTPEQVVELLTLARSAVATAQVVGLLVVVALGVLVVGGLRS